MPIHNWTTIPAGLFHDFHQSWTVRIKDALNTGVSPRAVSAVIEKPAAVGERLDTARQQELDVRWATGVVTLGEPVTRIVRRHSRPIYAERANRIVVKHHLGRIIGVIELVSPGNKDSRAALRDFVEKTLEFLKAGVHVLIVDLFPPTPRDPLGMHKVVWDEILEEDFVFPPGKDRILASYRSEGGFFAYVEPVAVGDVLPDMPLFLRGDFHVKVPLEPTYQAAWEASPEELRTAVETGVLPEPDAA